ncbi:MAG TPA: tetratricopeptide repeat protein, partial [Verrucomicrobiae bacterium]|nr:tetratricopeptide repeat protein [Verrucomicrobiae bacterium]
KITHTFVVTATRSGVFIIPPMTATIGGQVCKSDPVRLTVGKAAASPAGVNSDSPAFLRWEIPKTNVYVGEIIRTELQLYLREGVVKISDFQQTPPDAEGFTMGKMVQAQQHETRIGNVRYTVLPLVMTFTAAKVGTLTLGSAQAGMNLLFGPIDFFGRATRAQHVTLTNAPVTIQSLPLPTENVPPGFSGAVGNYSMTVNVSPTNVAVGDPITVKVDIGGRGALDGVRLPAQMGWDQFKAYPPTSEFAPAPDDPLAISGTNHFALTVVPQNLDVKELPPFVFTYFDPDRKSYQTLSHPAVPLIVRPSAASLPPPSLASGNSSDNPPAVQDVSPIKARIGAVTQLSQPLVWRPWFLALQAVPVLAWAGLLIRRKQAERLANNPRLRRQRQVERTIRTGLKELHRAANAGEVETFFAMMFHLLQEQLGERLDLPASAITEAVLDEHLRPIGVSDSQLEELRELFQMCNQARYAHETSNAELVSLISRVEGALNELKSLNVKQTARLTSMGTSLMVLLLALVALNVSARDVSTDFDSANKLYEEGRYGDAVSGYDKLLASGDVSEAIYFNRGNAFFKLGEIGRAIASYRQAERLAPRDHELRANLQLARVRARGGAPYHSDHLRDFLSSLSLNEWTVLTAIAFWSFFILLAFCQWKTELRARLKNYILATGGATILLGLCFGLALYLEYLTPSAIVVTGEADVRNGPLDESPGVYKVRDGAELQVLDHKDNWLQVEDPAMRVGWLRDDQALIFDSNGIHTPKT